METKKKPRSIRTRIVVIYVLLVFITTTIIGVFLLDQLEDYYINSVRTNMTNTVQEGTLITSLNSYGDISERTEEIQATIDAWSKSMQEEIFVVDSNFIIVASSNANEGKSGIDILDQSVILQALSGEISESFGNVSSQENTIPVMNMAFPIGEDDEKMGALYLRTDMSSIEATIHQSKEIFLRAMLISIAITIILGYLIAKSITEPINDVTQKAQRMAEGDFSQEVSVKSNDEIGQLAEMFNLLRIKLNQTLSQMSYETNKLETVLRHMADGLIAVDLSGKIIHVNQAAKTMLKIFEQETEALQYDKFMENFCVDLKLEKLIEGCAKEPATEIFEVAGFTYGARYDKFKDDNCKDIGIIMIIQDITERQKLENMQMDFVANVSHELKTPLTTIKSYTETLLDGAMEDPNITKEFLTIVDTEADRMNRLVKDLLQLSRIEHNQERWYKKESDLVTLLKSCVTKVSIMAQGKNQRITCIFDPEEVLPVMIDKDGIEQVFLNILSNSIKYTQEGGRIDVDAVRNGKYAKIVIIDNGIGVSESELSRVFERFFRVDKARSRAMGGTGLGLAISKQIVEEHRGTIEFESKENKGTTVTVSIPLTIKKGRKNIE